MTEPSLVVANPFGGRGQTLPPTLRLENSVLFDFYEYAYEVNTVSHRQRRIFRGYKNAFNVPWDVERIFLFDK